MNNLQIHPNELLLPLFIDTWTSAKVTSFNHINDIKLCNTILNFILMPFPLLAHIIYVSGTQSYCVLKYTLSAVYYSKYEI